jgi:acyl-CoA reductase-like NAD-dependent aldehyde dehydrogenase
MLVHKQMGLIQKAGTDFGTVFAKARQIAPEAFDQDSIRNLIGGEWVVLGSQIAHKTPVDQSDIVGPSMINLSQAEDAVAKAVKMDSDWSKVDLQERKARVAKAVELIAEHRDTIAMLLLWEIGKPWKIACADVDRCIDGVKWYLEEIDRQMEGRTPLPGPISNIASWNYPFSVLVHAELVELLAGNAVIAKTPSQGGFHALTLGHALMVRAGLPVTLISGSGSELSSALVSSPALGSLAFVGGRNNGRAAASSLTSLAKRHTLEQEGLNSWGIWNYSNWDELAAHLTKGFEYAKQRCTAYPRYVVQRTLFPEFLEMYTKVLKGLKFGHPLAVQNPDDDFPDLHFSSLISAKKVSELEQAYTEAITRGGVPLYQGKLSEGSFIDGQDLSAYFAPRTVLEPPKSWSIHHSEPFGPLDSVVLADTEAELIAAMNVSNGNLVSSVATDDMGFAERVRDESQAFKFGINKPRSRGDKAEVFGGRGASWRGCFVGGDLLVDSVTEGPGPLMGNFADGSRYPENP